MEIKRRNLTTGVRAWVESVVIPTYPAQAPEVNPMFLERRVYQGSSGKVYPLPFTDRISREKEDRVYQAVHIENEYLYLMILPEIGGRIHVALDKTNDYDFFYRQNVIKPALVGLAGPWISGGVEINWPQHHRPSTFMPCEFTIEEHEDGSRTVWLSEHEPMNRMKGMHGVCLRPGSACIELKGRVYNRTPFVQSFLWWANVGVHVNEQYQSFFPPDVHFVADHAKRAMSTFPECTGFYYGVDYRPATGLDWYKNIPVPTSYMVVHSEFDFFGGYDHGKRAGFVHVADRHIAPGKKQWTWGNHPFGWAWDRNLTDSDGPYVELMAGVFTDNQPDFSFLAPYETRTFKQVWYPIQGIGPATNATEDAAISVRISDGQCFIGISPSKVVDGAYLEVAIGSRTERFDVSAAPGRPWVMTLESSDIGEVRLRDQDGETIVCHLPALPGDPQMPVPASEPCSPEETESIEELYLTGLHLEQYRHATRKPEPYWLEALRRDPMDSRCNLAIANWRLRRGEYASSESHARRAIDRLTQRNPNPRDGEAFYVLGMALERQLRHEEAIAAYKKATWSYGWAAAAHYRIGCLETGPTRLEHLYLSLTDLGSHNAPYCLIACLWRVAGDPGEAYDYARQVLDKDPLDHWALREASLSAPGEDRKHWQDAYRLTMRDDPQNYLDLAIDYAQAGETDEAISVLDEIHDSKYPMIHYAQAFYSGTACTPAPGRPDYCFPSRLEEIDFLQAADPHDSKAPYYLGNLLYDRRRYDEAIEAWERSVLLDPNFSVPWRNLGISYFNVRNEPEKARRAFEMARKANPTDARLMFEQDQLLKRTGESPEKRLAQMDLELVKARDDLSLELSSLYNQTGQPEQSLGVLESRHFAPWEGGEGVALREWVRAQLALGKRFLAQKQTENALDHFLSSEVPPESLGEARHLLANASDVWFWLGECYFAMGDRDEARKWWTKAAEFRGDFQEMSVRSFSEMTYFQALSLRRLGHTSECESVLRNLLDYAEELERAPARIDYFATSLPAMLLFEDDLQLRQSILAWFLRAQALSGFGRDGQAQEMLDRVIKADPSYPVDWR